MFASLLVACELLVQCSATYYAHVTSSGTINDYCTLSSPCGLFPTVLDNIRDGTIPSTNANDDITIIINGTNPQLPYACVSSGYLYEMHHNITIIFDPNGSPTTDSWFPGVGDCLLFASCVPGTCVPSSLFHMHAYSSLKIYNMIWESVDYLFIDSEEHSSFYCENCTFKNLHGNLILLLANSAVFYDCLFDNITGLFLRMYPIPTTDMSAATHTNINISHCQFTNIAATNFIQMDSTVQYKKSVHVEYSSINTKPGTFARFIYVVYDLPFTNRQNSVSIHHTSFYGEISVLYVEEESVVNVVLDDVDISYSQSLPVDVLDSSTESNPKSVLFIGSDETEIYINTLTVTTLLYCTTDSFSYSPELRRRLSLSQLQLGVPYCAYPVPFIINSGVLNIYNMTLLSDYDAEYWQNALQNDVATSYSGLVNFNNSGMYYMLRLGKFDPTLHQTNEPYLASILNDNHGSLRMDRVRVGVGAHYSVLYNKGDAWINNMQTNWYFDPELYYNRWQLRLASYVTNRGSVEIQNSVLKGCDAVLIHIYGGSVRIIDSILSQSMKGIVTFYSADSVYIQNVSMDQIGRYYATLGAAYYFSGGTEYDDIPPIYLVANDISIVDSNVLYTDPLGIVSVGTHGLYDTDEEDVDVNKTVYMNNNAFMIESFTDFTYLSSLLTGHFGAIVPISAMSQFVAQFESTSRASRSIEFEGSYTVIIGNSVFEARNVSTQSVYINVDTADNCMASNRYYNYDLIIQSGDILSCKHVDYARINRTQNDSCFDAMGALNIEYKDSNEFVNSLIVLNHSLSTVYIDDAVLDRSYIHIVHADTVNIFDTILSYRFLSYPSYCSPECYQIMQQNHSKIRQLILNCNRTASAQDSFQSIDLIEGVKYEVFSFFSASAILLNAHTNNTLLYPGGVIHIDYNITDKYGNVISDYPHDIYIHLLSAELNINMMINIIDSECDVCVTGVYVQGVTIHDVGQQYTLSSSVMNGILLSNDIVVEIIPCPSGFGIAGAAFQCDECTDGYYSIESNTEACHKCNDDVLDGITCLGGDSIGIDYNYWMDITEINHTIISNDCPNGYCCQVHDGCDYIQDGQQHNLCAMNRDPSISLCGGCLDGYSEILGSVACKRCDRNNYEYILLPIAITLLFLLYLLYFDAPSNTKSVTKQLAMGMPNAKSTDELEEYQDEKAQKMVIRDDMKGIQLMVLKVIVYFYQGLLYILSAASNMDAATYFLLPILQIFNLSIEFGGSDSSSQDGGYCFLQGMTAQMEILLNLAIPVLLFVSIFVIALTKCKTKCCGRSPSHWTALWRAILIGLGSVLAVLFKILTCRSMHKASVHYYFGAQACYQTAWLVALFTLIVIILLWVILYVKLYKMGAQRRYLVNNNNLYTLVKAYKPKYWYWESVLLSRRIFVALFTISSIESAPNLLIITLNVILCGYFGLQLWKQPFVYTRANRLETLCIFVLIVVLGYVNIDLPPDETMAILLSLGLFICVIVVPGLCLLLEVCKLFRHLTKTKYTNRRLTKLSARVPKHLSTTKVTSKPQGAEDEDGVEMEHVETTKHRKST
eukprot:207162_1